MIILGSHAKPGAVVDGFIHDTGWVRPAGNHEPRLVRGFIPGVHDGLDIAFGRVGDPIYAAAPGKVLAVEHDAHGALFVALDHADPYRTLYGHLNDETVTPGRGIVSGALTGHCGFSGHTIPEGPGGAHLHLELYLNDTRRLNPWPYIWQNVRIKPKNASGIRLRTAKVISASTIYAETVAGGHIVRVKDDYALGLTDEWRRWDGIELGGEYDAAAGGKSTRWERIWLDGRWLYIASDRATRSVS